MGPISDWRPGLGVDFAAVAGRSPSAVAQHSPPPFAAKAHWPGWPQAVSIPLATPQNVPGPSLLRPVRERYWGAGTPEANCPMPTPALLRI